MEWDFFFSSGACIFSFILACTSPSLTVDGESHSSGQVRFQVVVIQPLALVQAAVGALDGLEDQEAVLASDGFVLEVEGQRQTVKLNTAPGLTEEQGGKNTHISGEVKLGLRVSVGLAPHGDGVALLDRVGVDEDEGRRLRGVWMDGEQVRAASGQRQSSHMGLLCFQFTNSSKKQDR